MRPTLCFKAGQPARWGLSLLFCLAFSSALFAADYDTILIPESCHPAIQSAAKILAWKLNLPDTAIKVSTNGEPKARELMLVCPPTDTQARLFRSIGAKIAHDGYAIVFKKGGAKVLGARPRSLLYAAGDLHLWEAKKSGTYTRDPAFAIRVSSIYGNQSIAECVAYFGVNILRGNRPANPDLKDSLPEVFNALSPQNQNAFGNRTGSGRQDRVAQECHDADVEYYPLLYGNDVERWSPALYDALVKVYPSAKGTSALDSWEKGTLCPSDPMTWKFFEAYIKGSVEQSHADGLYATFWDNYGIDCQCDRCVKDGMNQFSNQLYEIVKHYNAALEPLGKKLIMRTWSSGASHWLNDEWVHAPGFGGLSGEGTNLWGRVIREVSPDVILQTKVYNADCQPDPPFSTLLGHGRPHNEIAEWQITGQTTGRFYFPASTVHHTDWTMKKSMELIGPDGGVDLFPGGTRNSGYNLLDDICNSMNVYVWRELSWNVRANVDDLWMQWAVPIYGEKAAPHIIRALKLSEDAVNHLFSPLGLGSDTESGFAGTIQRREALLKYTNRHFLPEGQSALEPTLENVKRLSDEKIQCQEKIEEMIRELDLARPYMKKEQADELATRFDWLKEFAVCNRYLDESLWRYRYLRYKSTMLTTDPGQMKYLAEAFDQVQTHQARLFQFNPSQQFSCYQIPLGELATRPSLGRPMSLMRALYDASRDEVENLDGADAIPIEWKR